MLLSGLFFPLAVNAASGSWTQKTAGGTISTGKQILASRTLTAPAGVPAQAMTTSISWQIQLLSPPPPGLEIKLCTARRCIRLPGLTGRQTVTVPMQAQVPYRFVYSVNSQGQLRPTLNVVSNQLTINYR
ncbi:flagellar protein FlhE [Citrobacter amalonaticus]|uniref:Flagellar protein FlhE n=1 Tax=Citrobacter amalonaticus TaxID=35703 RepID=A0A2S4RQ02_CITAM|nr:flagellar protein FlhE [Citrobacter amalonaticus]POT68962.1 flagellar protein FlhE [Citrobacter amalonaticus]POU59096.1 flagellar protein FlhE [Citrobacter amalonaticus]POV02325.1 flagellar protein FlhE [Citrobacter amalonaticus]